MMNPKNKKTAKQYLKKDPFLLFNEFNHKYYDLKRKCIFSKSISDIKNYNKKNDYTDENIEKGKIRGTIIHKACEIYCKTKNKPAALSHAGEYKNSVFNFVNAHFWNTWDVVVSEFQLADRITDVAGTLDLILEHKQTKQIVLADIKTGQYAPKVKVQLGGYINLLYKNFPDLQIDFCQVIFVHEDKCYRKRFETQDSLEEYNACSKLYYEKLIPW